MFSILGGIGLIFFGVRFLRKGLDRLFGGRLMAWLSQVTDNRLKAFFTGIGIGAVAPSSTGASLMTVQMLQSGRMEAASLLVVLLGTNVGMTVSVQFLAFRVQDYAGLLIFIGVVAFLSFRREILRGIGQCILALGLVFLSIDMIGTGAAEFSSNADILQILHIFSIFPWLLLIATALLTIFFQSSTASIGMGIAMASANLFDGHLLAWWVIGNNLGVGITSLLTAWGTLDGRRMGIANMAVKVFVALVLLLVPHCLETVFTIIPGTLERQIAMLHTNYNILVALVALPILPWLWKSVCLIIPDQSVDTFAPQQGSLDENALESPTLALACASRECLRMAEHIQFMFNQFVTAFHHRDLPLTQRIQKEDDVIDQINLALKDYLIRIDDGLKPAEVQWQFALHRISSDLEAVGDVIDKHLCDLLAKQIQEGVEIEGQDRTHLEEAFRRIMLRLETSIGLLTTRDAHMAQNFLNEKDVFSLWLREIQKMHYAHLSASNRANLASSASFLDMLNGLRRINSLTSAFGYAVTALSVDIANSDN